MWAARPARPLVGRVRELAVLEASLERSRSGEGRVVLCGGEAGIGKSRIVAELVERARRQGAVVLAGECVDLGAGLPYGPFVEILRQALIEQGTDALPGWAMAELRAILPGLGAPATSRAKRHRPPDEFARLRLLEAILETMRTLAVASPTVIVLEDVQWADQSTRDLVTFLVPNLVAQPVTIVATHRTDHAPPDDAVAAWLRELSRRADVQRVELPPFEQDETAAYMTSLVGETPDPGFVRAVHERSDGNPFAIEELTRAALEGGADAVPPALRDTILATLATLAPDTREIVNAAAVLGRIRDESLLAEIVGRRPDELVGSLRELVERRILALEPATGGYGFGHALTREVAYLDLLPLERRALHAAAASALEGRIGSRSAAADIADRAAIAYHRDAAGDPEPAFRAAIDAAAAAERVYAFADAAQFLERAIELWPSLPADAESLVGRAELLERGADARAMAGDADRACELARAAIDALGPDADALDAGRLWDRLGDFLWVSGQPGRLEAAREAVRLLSAGPPSAAFSRALVQVGDELLASGDREAGLTMLRAASDAADQSGEPVERALARMYLAGMSLADGTIDEAIRLTREAIRVATAAGRPREVGYGYVDHVLALQLRGRLEDSAAAAREAIEIGRRLGFLRSAGPFIAGNGVDTLNLLGRWGEAEQLVDAVAGGPGLVDQWTTVSRVAIAVSRGDTEAATRMLRTRVVPAHSFMELQVRRSLSWYEADLAAATGDVARIRAIVPTIQTGGWMATHEANIDMAMVRAGIAAEADAATGARFRGDAGTVDQAAAEAERLLGLAATIRRNAPAEFVLLAPYELTARAEATRIASAGDPEAWAAAAAAWAALPSPPWVACCGYREAEAHLGRAKPDRRAAGVALRGAHDIAAALGSWQTLRDIEALARRARIDLAPPAEPTAERRVATGSEPSGLTERELEILELLAAGLTNREIGERLFISPKTAGVHVSNILGKLGVRGRVEAATLAQRSGWLEPRDK